MSCALRQAQGSSLEPKKSLARLCLMGVVPTTETELLRQGGMTADVRKTSSDYGEGSGEVVRTSGQQGVPVKRRDERSILINL